MQILPQGREDPLKKEWQPTPLFLPGKPHGQRNLVGYSPWGCEESDTTEHAHTIQNVQQGEKVTPSPLLLPSFSFW